MLKQDPNNPNQAHLVTSLPFSRSNILAMTAGLSDVASSGIPGPSSSQSIMQAGPSGSSGGGGNTPSPAPPLGVGGGSSLSPASSIHSHIYSSAINVPGLPPAPVPVATTTEHIYSYARKPNAATATIAPSQISPRQQQQQQQQTAIYSTIGSKSGPNPHHQIIGDDIGLPPIPQNATFRLTQQALQHMQQHIGAHHHGLPPSASFHPPAPKENPYGISTSTIGSTSAQVVLQGSSSSPSSSGGGHVRLLNNATDSGSSSSASPHHHLHHPRQESMDNSRNETRDNQGQQSSSGLVSAGSRQYLLTSNPNTDSSNGSNQDSDAAV